MNTTIRHKWNNGQIRFVANEQRPVVSSLARFRKRYEILPNSYILFLGTSAIWKPQPKPKFQIKERKEPTPEAIKAAALLRAWREEDSEETQQTWELLKKALDENRLSDRKFSLE